MSKKPIKDYPDIALSPENIAGKVDFNDIFGRTAPLHIEIGSGKATFLVSEAQLQPENNFLGIEWANKYYKYAVDRIGRWQLPNVRIVRTDAAAFIAENISDNTVDCFHIYFPDPWPKKRHHKRRLICRTNVIEMLRCLKADGVINIATDHSEYFEWMSCVFADFIDDGSIEETEFIKPAGAKAGETTGTNFERKYLKEGRKTYIIAVKKV